MAEKLPSQAGRKVLLNIAAGRCAAFGLFGRSCQGHPGTMKSLRRNGLIDYQGQLTDAGLQMVDRLTITPEVAHVA